ncbi:MAG: EAL domain-containing protein [Cyanobacteria bacterium P01_F01_bin.53]
MNAALSVLLVRSSPKDIELIESVVSSDAYGSVNISDAPTLEDALLKISQRSFDIVLLSQGLPDTKETQFAMRILEAATGAPVISLASDSSVALAEGIGCGTQALASTFNHALETRHSVMRLADTFQQLKSSEERYALAAEGCKDGIWDWDLQRNSVYYSPHWKKMLALDGQILSDAPDEWFSRVHPEDVAGLKRSLEEHLSGRSEDFRCEYRIRRAYGDYVWVLSRGVALWNSEGEPYRMAGGQIDIHEHKQLAWEASHDGLTSLANRDQFMKALSKLSHNQQPASHVLCYLDLDHFKVVNDTCGHAAGDELLRQVAAMLMSNIRRSDLLARLGGDEFGLIICDCPLEQAMSLAQDLCDLIKRFRFCWKGMGFSIGLSIGLVSIPAAPVPVDELLSYADAACYAAKNKGRNQVQVYSNDNAGALQLSADHQWVSQITSAMEDDLFCLYYQEMKPLKPGGDVIWEVLLRLSTGPSNSSADDQDNDPSQVSSQGQSQVSSQGRKPSLMLPMAFIPPAERYDLMPKLDRWMIQSCFQQIQSIANPEIVYSLNLSGYTLDDDSFILFLEDAIAAFNIDPHQVCFEISESTVMANFAQVAAMIDSLKSLGFRFALDNFGSGISSLVYLQHLPMDYLKLDGSLISEINRDKVAWATLQSINNIGHMMCLDTIAGCVSDAEILATVKSLNIDYAQGFEIAKPCLFPPLGAPNKEKSLALLAQ